MQRITFFVLVLLGISAQPVRAEVVHSPAPAYRGSEEAVTLPWIIRFFGEQVLGWIAGKGLDYAWDRIRLATMGDRAADHAAEVSRAAGLSEGDRASLAEAETMFRDITATLRRGDLTDGEARRRIALLQQNVESRLQRLNAELRRIDARLHAMELEQQRQLRMIVTTQGDVLELRNQVVSLGGELVTLRGRISDVERRTSDVEQRTTDVEQRADQVEGEVAEVKGRVTVVEGIVAPDPNRYLRHGTYFALNGLYANASALEGDAAFGGGLSVQANLGRHIGIYGEALIVPSKVSSISGPEGSSFEWITFPVIAGVAVNLLPPQSPLSVQVSGGGGLSYSALRYYPPDYDPDLANSEDLANVANVIGTGKIEIGATPTLASAEPVLTIGYIGFHEPLAYETSTARSNAGRELWYVSLGVRMRTNLPGDPIRAKE